MSSNDIMWITPKNNGRGMKKMNDVTIKHYPSSGKPTHMKIIFRNGAWNKVSQHGRIIVGINPKKNIIVMKDPYPNNGGWCLCKEGKARYIRIPFTDENFDGEFNLIPDDDEAYAWRTERIRG